MNSLQFIGQDQAELTLEQYQLIEDAVITAARKPLVGRTVAPIRELNNFGITELKVYTQSQMTGASIGMAMVQGAADVVGLTPGTLSIPAIWKDFTIYFRDMESSRRIGIPLDTSLASEAGRVVAETEEELIWEKAGPYNGFMNATGRQTEASAGAWSTAANAYKDVSDSIADLEGEGYSGRPVLVVSPAQKADLRLPIGTTSDTVLKQIADLCDVVTCHFFADNSSALMVMPDPENFQLQIGQNVLTRTAQLPTGDYFFRVYEALNIEFKRPKSIVEITGITV